MAVISAQAYETSIINALAASDPQMNTALGTPIRKIITAVAQEMAAYNVDVNVTTTLYSLDSVSGIELDYLVGQFGFTRQEARAARGSVSVRRDNGDTEMTLEYGSYFYKPASATSEMIAFQSTAYQEMTEGVLTCDIAIVAVEAGSLGNVPADTITYMSDTSEYVFVTNPNPTSGGRDAETDEQLRQRFLLTVFRNIAGTKDQLLALALAHTQVNKANLVGQESRYSETVQVTTLAGDISTSTASVSNDKWALDVEYPLDVDRRYWVTIADTQELLGHGDYSVSSDGKTVTFHPRSDSDVIGPITKGNTYALAHSDITSYVITETGTGAAIAASNYIVDKTNGRIEVSNSYSASEGGTWTVAYKYNFIANESFVQIELDYFSKHNRGGIKTVDLFVDCLSPKNVTDIQYIDFDKLIKDSNKVDWVRDDGKNPVVGHPYIPLSYQPLFTSSGHISVGTQMVLYEDTHYKMIYDATKTAGSCRGYDAVELLATVSGSGGNRKLTFENAASLPSMDDETPVAIPYLHDYPVDDVQRLIDNQRIVTMDVQVHEAVHRYFVIYLSLMFSTFPKDSIIQSVKDRIMAWAEPLPFGYTIQLSDIETVAANTSGVDNVRTATKSDAGGKLASYFDVNGHAPGAYGILELQRDGSTFVRQYTNDFFMAENEIFEVHDVIVYPRTQQRWG